MRRFQSAEIRGLTSFGGGRRAEAGQRTGCYPCMMIHTLAVWTVPNFQIGGLRPMSLQFFLVTLANVSHVKFVQLPTTDGAIDEIFSLPSRYATRDLDLGYPFQPTPRSSCHKIADLKTELLANGGYPVQVPCFLKHCCRNRCSRDIPTIAMMVPHWTLSCTEYCGPVFGFCHVVQT
jgi:hypothetical protein